MKTLEEIQAYLDATVNTLLGQHRGKVEITDLQNHDASEEGGTSRVAYVTMVGGCRGCAGAKYALSSK